MASIGDQEPRCVNCGEVGHWAVACYNERVERPMPSMPRAQNANAWNNNHGPNNGASGRKKQAMVITKYAPPPPSQSFTTPYSSGVPSFYPPPPPHGPYGAQPAIHAPNPGYQPPVPPPWPVPAPGSYGAPPPPVPPAGPALSDRRPPHPPYPPAPSGANQGTTYTASFPPTYQHPSPYTQNHLAYDQPPGPSSGSHRMPGSYLPGPPPMSHRQPPNAPSALPPPVSQGYYQTPDPGNDGRPQSRASSGPSAQHENAESRLMARNARRAHRNQDPAGRYPRERPSNEQLRDDKAKAASPSIAPVSAADHDRHAQGGGGSLLGKTGPHGKPKASTNVTQDSKAANTKSSKGKGGKHGDDRWDEETIFAAAADIKADETANPLGSVYSNDILLPPKYGVNRTTSKYVTSANVSEYIKPLRETALWPEYEFDPLYVKDGKYPNGLPARIENDPQHLPLAPPRRRRRQQQQQPAPAASSSRKHPRSDPIEEGEIESDEDAGTGSGVAAGLGHGKTSGEPDRDLKRRRLEPAIGPHRVASRTPEPRPMPVPPRTSSLNRSHVPGSLLTPVKGALLPPAPSSLPARPPIRPPSPVGSSLSARSAARLDPRPDGRRDVRPASQEPRYEPRHMSPDEARHDRWPPSDDRREHRRRDDDQRDMYRRDNLWRDDDWRDDLWREGARRDGYRHDDMHNSHWRPDDPHHSRDHRDYRGDDWRDFGRRPGPRLDDWQDRRDSRLAPRPDGLRDPHRDASRDMLEPRRGSRRLSDEDQESRHYERCRASLDRDSRRERQLSPNPDDEPRRPQRRSPNSDVELRRQRRRSPDSADEGRRPRQRSPDSDDGSRGQKRRRSASGHKPRRKSRSSSPSSPRSPSPAPSGSDAELEAWEMEILGMSSSGKSCRDSGSKADSSSKVDTSSKGDPAKNSADEKTKFRLLTKENLSKMPPIKKRSNVSSAYSRRW